MNLDFGQRPRPCVEQKLEQAEQFRPGVHGYAVARQLAAGPIEDAVAKDETHDGHRAYVPWSGAVNTQLIPLLDPRTVWSSNQPTWHRNRPVASVRMTLSVF